MHEEQVTDQAAIDACRAGERQAFGVLVERYQEVAFRTAFLVLRDADQAADVAQDAFVRAYRNLHRFERDSTFRPWLLRIVRNLALNELRGKKRRANLLSRVAGRAAVGESALEGAAVEREQQRGLAAAINTLPENDRMVLYLRHYLELPEAEIAVIIGKRPGTVKSRLSRASGRLREVIERDYPSLVPQAAAKGGER